MERINRNITSERLSDNKWWRRLNFIVSLNDTLKKNLVFIWRDALQTRKTPKGKVPKFGKYFGSDKGSFFLSHEGVKVFNKIIAAMKSIEGVAHKFSDKYLETTIDDVIVELLQANEQEIQLAAQRQVDNILGILATPAIDWTLVAPIVNLEVTIGELFIGKVRFFKVDNDTEEKLRLRVERTYPSRISLPKGWDNFLKKTLKEFTGKVVAEVTISAVDNKRGEDIGIQEISDALNVLRFYRLSHAFIHPHFAKNDFDIQGNIAHAIQPLILFSSKRSSFPQEWKGFLRSFRIGKKALVQIKDDGFDNLSIILKNEKVKRTAFEKDLVVSMKFCALSTRDEQISNAFVNSIISLEALLLGEREAITDNLAERVAFIIGHTVKERNWYFDEMKRLYRIRNSIVHSGNTDIKLSDLILLQKLINYRCIVNLLKSYKMLKIKGKTNLINWIRKQKFSVGVV